MNSVDEIDVIKDSGDKYRILELIHYSTNISFNRCDAIFGNTIDTCVKMGLNKEQILAVIIGQLHQLIEQQNKFIKENIN